MPGERVDRPLAVRESLRRRMLAATLVAVIVIATTAVWIVLREREQDTAAREARSNVEATVARLGTSFQTTVAMFTPAATLVDANGGIDRARLETYASLLFVGSPVNAVAYSPIVPQAERAAFEARIGRPITDRDADGVATVAPRRERYVPVSEVVSPMPLTNDVVGFDVGHDPQRSGALAESLRTGAATVTPVVRLAGTGRPGFIVMQPLVRPGDTQPLGVLSVGYDAGRMGEMVVGSLPAGTVFRITDAGEELFRSADEVPADDVAELALGGRVWRFDYTTPLAISRTVSTSVLFAGLGVAAVVAAASISSFRHERRLLLWRLQTALERDLATELARTAGRAEVAATAAETIKVVAAAKSVSLGLIDGPVLRIQHSTSVPDSVTARWRDVPLDDPSPITDAARTGRAVVVRDLVDLRVHYPDLDLVPENGVRSAACVPLKVGDETIGSLAFNYATPQRFADADVHWLGQIADMVSGALERARLYDQQMQVVLTLQRDLLPNELPRPEGFALSAIYRPGDSAQLGGDWYDAFELPDGRLAIAIGDVAGRGVRAAASMGKLRHLIRACAGAYGEPSIVMAHANELICRGSSAVFATVLYATIDADGTCTMASAGHLPPLLMGPDGATLTSVKPGPPLGVTLTGTYTDTSVELRAGDALVLYTDGLIERRDEPLDVSLELFATVASTVGQDCDAATLVDTVGSDDRDDVAVLLVRLDLVADQAVDAAVP